MYSTEVLPVWFIKKARTTYETIFHKKKAMPTAGKAPDRHIRLHRCMHTLAGHISSFFFFFCEDISSFLIESNTVGTAEEDSWEMRVAYPRTRRRLCCRGAAHQAIPQRPRGRDSRYAKSSAGRRSATWSRRTTIHRPPESLLGSWRKLRTPSHNYSSLSASVPSSSYEPKPGACARRHHHQYNHTYLRIFFLVQDSPSTLPYGALRRSFPHDSSPRRRRGTETVRYRRPGPAQIRCGKGEVELPSHQCGNTHSIGSTPSSTSSTAGSTPHVSRPSAPRFRRSMGGEHKRLDAGGRELRWRA